VWPLTDLQEADLMCHYVDEVASCLDLCDKERHFALVVPCRTAMCPLLLNAIFAVSARHICRVANGTKYLAERYYDECLNELIPLLSDSASVQDENLLAATIILRFYEEMESPTSSPGLQSHHLTGAQAFISAREGNAHGSGLGQAAFWVGLRMELFFAISNSCPVLSTIDLSAIECSLDPADDCTWANRMVRHCAEALRYCFSDGTHQVADYHQMVQYCTEWMKHKPWSFTPLYYRAPDSENSFPIVRVLSDAVGTGLAHYHLTRILLRAHDPITPTLGSSQRRALQQADDEIIAHVRAVCGIAESNTKTPPYYVMACMAITMAGNRFRDRRDQEELLRVMRRGEELAWPTMTA
ncbi:hypothetical protein EJ06DRAFT_468410, partial [Trichodelitschia bisporula]